MRPNGASCVNFAYLRVQPRARRHDRERAISAQAGNIGGELERNYPDKSRHCEKPQATKQSAPRMDPVAPRWLPPGTPALAGGRPGLARNDSLCGMRAFITCGWRRPVPAAANNGSPLAGCGIRLSAGPYALPSRPTNQNLKAAIGRSSGRWFCLVPPPGMALR
jgi:hypothetical protein